MVFFPRKGFFTAAAFLLAAIASQAQPFTNGGFEILNGMTIPSNSSMTLDPGNTWLAGWSASGPDGAVAVQNGRIGTNEGETFFGLGPFQGNQWAVFPDDAAGGSLSQTFSTAVSSYCTITFDTGYVFTAQDPLLGVTVAAGNGSVLTNNDYAPLFRAWTNYQFSFLATTTNTTLTFYDATPEAQGAYLGIDGVSLVAEPPGWPYILTQPESATNAAGTEATFNAEAGGNPSTEQWYLGTNAVTNATNTTLTVVSSLATAGSYTAVFSNAEGTNITMPAILNVLQVLTSPTSQTLSAGETVTLTAASSLSNATVVWYYDGYALTNDTELELSFAANNQTAGTYWAQFSNGPASINTASALVTVLGLSFVNGSFEETSGATIPPGGDQVGNVGDQWLTGWDFGGSSNEVFVFNGPALGLAPVNGSQWIVFDSENSPPPGVVLQTFGTTIGHNYLVTFACAAFDFDYNPDESLGAAVSTPDGAILASNNIEPPMQAWSTNQLTFTAQTVNTIISFADTSFPNFGPSVALDAVSVVDLSVAPPALTIVAAPPASSSFVVQLAGTAGQTEILETSTNLLNWSPVSTNTFGSSPVKLTNALAPGATEQFWRAIPAP